MTIAMIRSMLSRADRLLADLEDEYQKCLNEKAVSTGALNLTHEVIEKCTNTLDQLMTHAWTVRIRPTLANPPARGGYFPAARDEAGFRSSLGHWQSTDLDTRDPDFARVLRSYQPMTDRRNEWVGVLRELAAKKHTGLVPQKRQEDRRVTVTGAGGGSVSWGPGVTFGPGVSVMGAPVNPQTQMPVPTPTTKTTVEIWVSFLIEGTDVNALGFCKQAVAGTEEIVEAFATALKLP